MRVSIARVLCYAVLVLTAAGAILMPPVAIAQDGGNPAEQEMLNRGRYLIKVGDCNSCHTPGYMQTPGQIPETDWLVGIPVGWRGPWGTTYAPNLRLTVGDFTEDAFVIMLKTRSANPPMAWAAVNTLTDYDARAIYRFIKSLGPKGERMPTYLPPNVEPTTPFISLELQNLPQPVAE